MELAFSGTFMCPVSNPMSLFFLFWNEEVSKPSSFCKCLAHYMLLMHVYNFNLVLF